MRQRKRPVIIMMMILGCIIFIILPLFISMAYGNIPFYDQNSLESSDIFISDDSNLTDNELSFISNNTYTWAEIKRYIIRKEMTFTKVFRYTVIIVLIISGSIFIDRLFFRRK